MWPDPPKNLVNRSKKTFQGREGKERGGLTGDSPAELMVKGSHDPAREPANDQPIQVDSLRDDSEEPMGDALWDYRKVV